MRTAFFLCMAAALALVAVAPASADILTLTQSGTDWTISVTRPPGVDEIASFDITLGFNSAVLTYDHTDYGALLGTPSVDPFLLTCIGCVWEPTASGNVLSGIAELSFLPTADLQGLQPQTFDLATVHFLSAGAGAPNVQILFSQVGDGFGNEVTDNAAVPEPGSWALLLTAMAGIGAVVRRRAR